jgi:RNA polymerase sigma factor (sigma-70 family)
MRPMLRVISGPPADGQQPDARAGDRALALAVSQGERAAIAALTKRCLPVVHSVARRLMKDASEADDIAQETFVKVWRAIDRYDADRARLETWVARIATNHCLDRLRKRREVTLGEDAPERIDTAPRADALWLLGAAPSGSGQRWPTCRSARSWRWSFAVFRTAPILRRRRFWGSAWRLWRACSPAPDAR